MVVPPHVHRPDGRLHRLRELVVGKRVGARVGDGLHGRRTLLREDVRSGPDERLVLPRPANRVLRGRVPVPSGRRGKVLQLVVEEVPGAFEHRLVRRASPPSLAEESLQDRRAARRGPHHREPRPAVRPRPQDLVDAPLVLLRETGRAMLQERRHAVTVDPDVAEDVRPGVARPERLQRAHRAVGPLLRRHEREVDHAPRRHVQHAEANRAPRLPLPRIPAERVQLHVVHRDDAHRAQPHPRVGDDRVRRAHRVDAHRCARPDVRLRREHGERRIAPPGRRAGRRALMARRVRARRRQQPLGMIHEPDPAPVGAVAGDRLARDEEVPHQVPPRREDLPPLVLAAELPPEGDERRRELRPAAHPARPPDRRAPHDRLDAARRARGLLAVDGRAGDGPDRRAELALDDDERGRLVRRRVHPPEDLLPGGAERALVVREPRPERIELGAECGLQGVHWFSPSISLRVPPPATGRPRHPPAMGARGGVAGLSQPFVRPVSLWRPSSPVLRHVAQ